MRTIGRRERNLMVWLRAVPWSPVIGIRVELTCRYSGVASRYGSKCAVGREAPAAVGHVRMRPGGTVRSDSW